MHRVKRRHPARILAAGLLIASSALGAYERLPTRGRRLQVEGNWLIVTAAERERVALFDVSGDRPRKVGEFGGEQGQDPGFFMGPHGAALSGSGELIVADAHNQRLQAFDFEAVRAGVRPALRRIVGRPGTGPGEFDGPSSGLLVSRDPALAGLLFVADRGNGRVQVLDAHWRFQRAIGERGAKDGSLEAPSAIAFDPTGRVLYVADEGHRQLSAFDARSGESLFVFRGCPDEPLAMPAGLATAPDGELLVTDRVRRRLLRLRPELAPDGRPRRLSCAGGWGRYGSGPGEWQYPQSVAVDGRGRVYVCDQLDDRCQMFTADGRFLARIAGDWQPPEWTAPAREPEASAASRRTLCSNAGTFGVRFRSDPEAMPLGEPFELAVELSEGCGEGKAPAQGVALRVHGYMPEHRHGMNSEPRALPAGPGRFGVGGVLFHMAGLWELYFDVTRDGVLERAQLDLRIE